MFFAFAAADAVFGACVGVALRHTHGVFAEGLESAVVFCAVQGRKDAGNIDAGGAGHAVAAAGAGDDRVFRDLVFDAFDKLLFGLGETSRQGFGGDLRVFFKHFQGIHSGEDAGDLGLVPEPSESCRRGRVGRAGLLEQ